MYMYIHKIISRVHTCNKGRVSNLLYEYSNTQPGNELPETCLVCGLYSSDTTRAP